MISDYLLETFGSVVYRYTRAQAVADGFQVEVTKTAQEAGIRFPFFITRAVWDAYVTVPPGVTGQDEAGRLWDLVWMTRFAIIRAKPGVERIPVALYVRNDNHRSRLVKLVAVCGGLDIDDPQPANRLATTKGERRTPWFACACCPPNVVRFIPQVPGLFYAVKPGELFVNLYGTSALTFTNAGASVEVSQVSDYPWDGNVRLTVKTKQPAQFKLHLRLPGWIDRPLPSDLYTYSDRPDAGVMLKLNGRPLSLERNAQGYLVLDRAWKNDELIELELPMPVRQVIAHANVESCRDRVAIVRGPLVYCAEGPDNDGTVHSVVVEDDTQFSTEARPTLLNGVTVLRGDVQHLVWQSDGGVKTPPRSLTLIPYYAWAHRGNAPMRVWLARTPSAAWPSPTTTVASQAKVSASSVARGAQLEALNDQVLPANSADREVPRFAWAAAGDGPVGAGELEGGSRALPGGSGVHWVQYQFASPVTLSRSAIYWAQDRNARQGLPATARLLVPEGEDWKVIAPDLSPAADRLNGARFDPVTTRTIRLETNLSRGVRVGLMEWKVK